MNNSELYKLWDEFLDLWPVRRVEAMTLEEYTKAGDPDSFMNWVEFGPNRLQLFRVRLLLYLEFIAGKIKQQNRTQKTIFTKINMLGELHMAILKRVLFCM